MSFGRQIFARSASHERATDLTRVSSTVCRSKVERLITLSTSAVAVCCRSDSVSSAVRCSTILSSLVAASARSTSR